MSAISKRNILSYGDRERIKRNIDSERRRLEGQTEGIPNRYQRYIDEKVKADPKRIIANINKLEKVLSEGSPDSLSRREKLEKEKQIEKDREWLRSNMVPKKSYHIGWRDIKEGRATQSEYDEAVKGCVKEQSPAFQKVAIRYKNNMREVDPENPSSSNIENIRPI